MKKNQKKLRKKSKRSNKTESIVCIFGMNIAVGTLISLGITLLALWISYLAITRDQGKLKFEYVKFIEAKTKTTLKKDTCFEFKMTNIGNRTIVTDYLIAQNKNKELYRWQVDSKILEGESINFNLSLERSNFWVLKEIENFFIIDTKGKKWYLNKKDTLKIKDQTIELYRKWVLPESHNVDEKQYFILREEVLKKKKSELFERPKEEDEKKK